MNISNMTLAQFTEELSSPGFPTPAGGATGSVSVAMAASLLAMCCHVSAARKPETHWWAEPIARLQALRQEGLCLAQRDIDAYGEVIRNHPNRKDYPEIWAQAMDEATRPLIDAARCACQVLDLAGQMQQSIVSSVRGDLVVAVHLAHGALEGLCPSISINARLLEDPKRMEEMEALCQRLRQDGQSQFEKILAFQP